MEKTETELESEPVGAVIVGGAAGGAQVYLLRNYADKPRAPIIASLGNWGQPSALVDLVTGAIGSILGLWTFTSGESKPAAAALTGYGLSTLAGGIYSGMKPVGVVGTLAPKRVPARLPSAPTPSPTQTVPQRGLTVVPTSREVAPGIVIRGLQM